MASMRLKYHYEFMGWDGLLLLNISHNYISKIAAHVFFNLNQLTLSALHVTIVAISHLVKKVPSQELLSATELSMRLV